MPKRITAPVYTVAWLASVVGGILFFVVSHTVSNGSTTARVANGPWGTLDALVLIVAGIVGLVMVIGALINLGSQRAWGWFTAVLILEIVGLGIIGMVLYWIVGPRDTPGARAPTDQAPLSPPS